MRPPESSRDQVIRSLSDEQRVLATAAYLGQDSLGDVRAAYESSLSVLARRPVAGGEALHPADAAQRADGLGTLRYADRQKLLKAIGVCIDQT